jgi:hypothetical protein
LPAKADGPPDLAEIQKRFLALVPAVLSSARRLFRALPCPQLRDDLAAEAVAIAWRWYRALAERRRDPDRFGLRLARLAALAVSSGRRLCGGQGVHEPFSIACRRRHGVRVSSIGDVHADASLAAALADGRHSPVPEQAAFRVDFPAWKSGLPVATQAVLAQLALGHRTRDVAASCGRSPARVAQIRRELRDSYLRFLSGPRR